MSEPLNPVENASYHAFPFIQVTTIEAHILEQQRTHPEATGVLTSLLYDIALSAKIIAHATTRAGLIDVLGKAGLENVQGEQVARLDLLANETLIRVNACTGRLAGMASEENADIIPIPAGYRTGPYVLLFDPLDGSSNTDYTISIGTIFSIYRRKSKEESGQIEDFLQPGRDLVAAGYVIYGNSTVFVYSTGQGVHGFTLDPGVGEFLLSHPNIRIPDKPQFYSVNQGYERYWSSGVRQFTDYVQGKTGEFDGGLSMRYVGSLVADFHRNLLAGGIFYYPADSKDPGKPHGKLRLLYECASLAYIAEQAGGYASDGRQPILDIVPTSLHQRTPFFVGVIS
ncbi:MAG: class 1 fructose-bisphosphatase [Chloroflexi bacterium HGW-Chloroflexi-1]|nr:MAG: class 1 fructose-bisphosphatase [Chloroflexi bacterium HGW-Chloroflexi-1]